MHFFRRSLKKPSIHRVPSKFVNDSSTQQIDSRIAALKLSPREIFEYILAGHPWIYGRDEFKDICSLLPQLSPKLRHVANRLPTKSKADELFLLVQQVNGLTKKAELMNVRLKIELLYEQNKEIIIGLSKALSEVLKCNHLFDVCKFLAERAAQNGWEFSGAFFQEYSECEVAPGTKLLESVVEDIAMGFPECAQFVSELPNIEHGLRIEKIQDIKKAVDGMESNMRRLKIRFNTDTRWIPSIPRENFNQSMQKFFSEYDTRFTMLRRMVALLEKDFAELSKLLNFSAEHVQVNRVFDGLAAFITNFKIMANRIGLNLERPAPTRARFSDIRRLMA